MARYEARIDGGQGGNDTFVAGSAAEALMLAIEWAREGDWPDEGCDVYVSVENEDDEDDSASDTIHIDSAEELKNVKLDEDGEVLGEDEGEWVTEQVIRIADEYFYRRCNGGSRGAYDNRTNPDVFECAEITRPEARAKLLKWLEPAEVAEKTA